MRKFKSLGLQSLRAKIRGFQIEGQSIHREIKRSKGLKRQDLWVKKRQLGSVSRSHMIAYGLLRNKPYSKIEKCHEQNKPYVKEVYDIVKEHSDPKWEAEWVKYEEILELLTKQKDASPLEVIKKSKKVKP